MKRLGCDLFHCTRNFGIPHSSLIPTVTTIHDLIPLCLLHDYAPTYIHKKFFQINYEKSINSSNALISISNYTSDVLIRMYPECKKKLHCIYQGCDFFSFFKFPHNIAFNIMNSLGVSNDYILAIGGAEPRKNIRMLIDLYDAQPEKIPCDLVLLGGDWSRYKVPIPKTRRSSFHLLGHISDRELMAAYKAASVFVFPSIYEGFGLPVLEAMASGTPVIAHNGTSIPEVAGNAAMLVDMTDRMNVWRG